CAPASTEIYTLSLHDALPISHACRDHSDPSSGRFESCQTECLAPSGRDHAEVRASEELRHPGSIAGQHHVGSSFQTLSDGLEMRSEEHTSELQSRENLVCRLL